MNDTNVTRYKEFNYGLCDLAAGSVPLCKQTHTKFWKFCTQFFNFMMLLVVVAVFAPFYRDGLYMRARCVILTLCDTRNHLGTWATSAQICNQMCMCTKCAAHRATREQRAGQAHTAMDCAPVRKPKCIRLRMDAMPNAMAANMKWKWAKNWHNVWSHAECIAYTVFNRM